jgi:hypothetical protein
VKCINNKKMLENINERNKVAFSEFQPDRLMRDEEPKAENELSKVESYRLRIDEAEGFSGVWEIVKETVKVSEKTT